MVPQAQTRAPLVAQTGSLARERHVHVLRPEIALRGERADTR